MKLKTGLTIVVASLAVSILMVVGVALAQNDWMPGLAADYAAVWQAAYNDAGKHHLPMAGREAVAERVLDAYVATRSAATDDHKVVTKPVTPTPTLLASDTPPPSDDPGGPTPGPYNLPIWDGPATPVSSSDIDGYATVHEIELTTTGQLLMTTWNFHTAGGHVVLLAVDGTLTIGGEGLSVGDRFSYSCAAGVGLLWRTTTYASGNLNVDLPQTVLNTAPLFSHPMAILGMQVCAGEVEPPSESIYEWF